MRRAVHYQVNPTARPPVKCHVEKLPHRAWAITSRKMAPGRKRSPACAEGVRR